jgi:hypothetical protein
MEAIQATDSAEEVLVVCVVLEFYVVGVGVHFNASLLHTGMHDSRTKSHNM